jgi:signal transduction histidine kinase
VPHQNVEEFMSIQENIQDLNNEIRALREELKTKEENYQFQHKELLSAKEKAEESEHMLHTLVETAVGTIGQDFFDTIVINLSKWLDVDCVIIGQMLEPNRIHCLPLYLDGKISHDFSYELAGSPCDVTTRKGFCCFTENVIEQFPKDKILVDLNAKGYIGTALYNKEGNANGVICAVSRKKFIIPAYTERMLKIIGSRVSAEIERKKVEEDLKNSEAELRESNATKDKFISVIAHDLKNPFNSILGFSELLLGNNSEFNKAKQLKCIRHIHDTAKNTYSLLENLLTWSFAKQGSITVTIDKTNINEVINDSILMVSSLADVKLIEIQEDINGNLNAYADKSLLSVVIRNLLTNAIKYSVSGSTIIVSARINGHAMVEISVIDCGVGIDAEKIVKLFKIDHSFSTPGTNKEKGTGLGLILCKEFIDKMNGHIWAESEPEKGSKFIFTLKHAS